MFDPDNPLNGDADPNDPDPTTNVPRDNTGDGSGLGVNEARFPIVVAGDSNQGSKDLTINKPQPGNNFIAVAHSVGTVLSSLKFRDDGVSLYYQKLGSTSTFPVPGTHRTDVLSVWRTLWFEADHMAAPVASDGPFDGANSCNGCDDPMVAPKDPSMGVLANLLVPAQVIVQLLPATYDWRDDVRFQHNLTTSIGREVRDAVSQRYFWHVHMIGAYEGSDTQDNDPDNEEFLLGWSDSTSDPVPSNFVFFETIRDVIAEPQYPNMVNVGVLEGRVAAHEALHRFFGWHNAGRPESNEGIMDAMTAMTQANIALTGGQIRIVQSKDNP